VRALLACHPASEEELVRACSQVEQGKEEDEDEEEEVEEIFFLNRFIESKSNVFNE
jgi:hypothetical protein